MNYTCFDVESKDNIAHIRLSVLELFSSQRRAIIHPFKDYMLRRIIAVFLSQVVAYITYT